MHELKGRRPTHSGTMSELCSSSKLFILLYQKTVIYWLCCRDFKVSVVASRSQLGKVTE